MGERLGSALEFDQAVKALDEHIEVLKQELLFAIAEERRTESTTQSNTIKRELDKAAEEGMKFLQIYCRPLVFPMSV
jgi:hypothetical protein